MSASTTTLTTLTNTVELLLRDSGNDIWSTDQIQQAIEQALAEYSQACPYQTNTTLQLSSAGREIDISSISGLLAIHQIWLPYTASDPEYPPNTKPFQHWPDSQILYVDHEDEPASGDVVRIFYTKLHTLDGLNGESTTTFSAADEQTIAIGAAGFAASARSIDLTEKVTLSPLTSQQIKAWGISQLQEFRKKLRDVKTRSEFRGSSIVQMSYLDNYHQRDLGWS